MTAEGGVTAASANPARPLDAHEHEWSEVRHARFTGNPHRFCNGCGEVTLDLEDDEPETLGSCGCTDYHMADCPTRQPAIDDYEDDPYDNERW